MSVDVLLRSPVRVINIGLESFANDFAARGVPVAQVDWRPPAGGKVELLAALESLSSHAQRIAQANASALARMLAADPVLIDVRAANALIPALRPGVVLHAGPPITWQRMCGPMRGAVIGAIVYEGWAADLADAERLAASGAITFAPNHHHDAVGPMTGITTASMPLMVVQNRKFGNRAYCAINEGLGKVMRFGGNDAEVLERLRWLRDCLGPALGAALRECGGVELSPLIARGLSMGDEMHQRNVACSSLLLRALAPALARTMTDSQQLAAALSFIAANDQFFLNVAMAMGKSIMDPVRGIRGSSIVTAMSRNGTDFGVRVSGCGDTWFSAPVEMPRGLYFPGFSETDANPDMGDSSIVETIGLGAFAMAAAPAVAGFVGAGGMRDALYYTQSMGEIAAGRNPRWTVPALDFQGVPCGIDVVSVVESNIAPAINTGIAHREPGVGQVGAGVARAPLACFEQALIALAQSLHGTRTETSAR
jgi:hypothetical protein